MATVLEVRINESRGRRASLWSVIMSRPSRCGASAMKWVRFSVEGFPIRRHSFPGGFTTSIRKERIAQFRQYLTEVTDFIKNIYIPDVNQVGTTYRDYFQIGTGCKNLIAYGVFDLDDAGRTKLLRRGIAPSGS